MAKKITGAIHNLTGRAPCSVQKFVSLEQHVRFVVYKNTDH